MAQALVGLGSNLGEARDQVRAALAALTATWGVHEVRGARLHTFPAVGGPAGQADFVNTAARIETSLAADELLAALLSIEARLGRTRQVRWGPRTIDLDLLLYDDLVRDTPHLTLPHPRMQVRRFVLDPAAEVAGDMIHATTGWTIAQLAAHLRTTPRYVAIAGPPGAGKTRLALAVTDQLGGHAVVDIAPAAKGSRARATDAASWPTRQAARELEFGRARSAALRAAGLSPSGAWVASDFWIEQSAAHAEAAGGEGEPLDGTAEAEPLASTFERPRFVVCLRGSKSDERLAQAIERRLKRPTTGPVLWLNDTDFDQAVVETVAAMRASDAFDRGGDE